MGVTRQGDDGGGLLTVLRDPAGKPLAIERDGQTGYYVQDWLGSVIGMVDNAGAVLVSYSYDPYSNIRSAPGQDVPLAWWNPYTYTGALKDSGHGLYRMGVRWYDPNTVVGATTAAPATGGASLSGYLWAVADCGAAVVSFGLAARSLKVDCL